MDAFTQRMRRFFGQQEETDGVDTESRNLREIERLNQRGGRTLSVIDLMQDGTITAEMAAFCWTAVEAGTSFITGAVPGGAGKTTLMATLLGFLPPEERIMTVSDRRVVERALRGEVEQPASLLAHEIGSGHWFGYIWGRDAADFFSATDRGLRCVSCLHADDPAEAWEIVEPLGVARGDFDRLSLQLYMRMEGGMAGRIRRVAGLYCAVDGGLRHAYRWKENEDEFERLLPGRTLCDALGALGNGGAEEPAAAWREREEMLCRLSEEGVHRFEDVRQRVVQAYRR